MTTWTDVAHTMAADTDRAVDDPLVTEAVDALKATSLKPDFVLSEWQMRAPAASPTSVLGDPEPGSDESTTPRQEPQG